MRARLARWGGPIATLALVGAWAVLLRPGPLGGTVEYVVVRGDSMQPTYETGELVVVRAAAAYAPGDVVAYRVPAGELGAGRLVIHRIVGGSATDGFVMQGDNNPAPDPWRPRGADVAGRAWIAVPLIGRIMAILHQPAIAAALAVGLLAAVAVWRRGFARSDSPQPVSGRRGPPRVVPSRPWRARAGRTG